MQMKTRRMRGGKNEVSELYASRYNPSTERPACDGGRKGYNMTLQELWSVILESSREDWHFIGSEEPSFHGKHSSTAVYIPNVSITLAWGRKWQEDYQAEWCKKFPNPSASGEYADVFFNNSLVYRTPYIWVDGIYFPNPRSGDKGLEVNKQACSFMKLIESMGSTPRPDHHLYEVDLRRTGFFVVNEEWPEFPEI
jgi:hypothetical protein